MANLLRFIGLNPGTTSKQTLAHASLDTLLVSNINSDAGLPLVISSSLAFTNAALTVVDGGSNLLVLSSVAPLGTGLNEAFRINDKSGLSLMTLTDDGQLALRGAAVVGTGSSTVAGTINFNGSATFGNDAVDTVTFARGWGAVSGAVQSSISSSLVPSSGFVVGGTRVDLGVDILVGTGGSPNTSVSAKKGSLLLSNEGTAWINTDGTTAWSPLAVGAGNNLQASYDLGQSINTTVQAAPVAISATAGVHTLLSVDSSGATGTALALTADSGNPLLSATGGTLPALILAGSTNFGYGMGPGVAAAGAHLSVGAGAATAGAGGNLALTSGAGAGVGNAGGALSITAGGAGLDGDGGSVSIASGNGGPNGRLGGNLSIEAGTHSIGSGPTVDIVTTNAASLSIGTAVSSFTVVGSPLSSSVTIWSNEVLLGAGDPVVQLNTGATLASTAVGSYAIGVGTNAFAGLLSVNGVKPHEDLQATLEALDSAVGTLGTSAVHTLQKAYDGGAAVTVAANAPLSLSGGATAGGVLSITDAGTSGTSLLVNNTGSNTIFDVQDGGTSVLLASSVGAVSLTPTSGQGATVTTAGVGAVSVSSSGTGALAVTSTSGAATLGAAQPSGTVASGNVTVGSFQQGTAGNSGFVVLGSQSAAATSGSVDLSSIGVTGSGNTVVKSVASGANATAGNVLVYSESTNATGPVAGSIMVYSSAATPGGVVISADTSAPAIPASGTVSLTATGDITLAALAGSITVNQVSDINLVAFTATSIVGALNELKVAASTDSAVVSYISGSASLSAGDVVTTSPTTDGSVVEADASNGAQAVLGIALNNAAVGVVVNVLMSGQVTGLLGLTRGAPYYLSATPGAPTGTAPGVAGDLLIRVGWATSATELAVAIGEGTVI